MSMAMSAPIRIAAFSALIAAGTPADAAVYSPRILSQHNADTYSLKTFAEYERWRDLQGDAKVFAVFQYLADRRTGIYPMGVPAWEGNETLAEYGAVTDPIKMLNVYPIGHCGTLGPTAAAIMEGMGIGPARALIIRGWNHVAAEVSYDRKWHYLDLDVRAVFRRPNGELASMAEAQKDDSLWTGTNNPLFFPLDNLKTVREVYAKTAVEHRYGVSSGGHTMDFVLRQGETFTRWWKPQGGRWNHHPSYAAKPFPRNTLERAPLGPKCKHDSFTVHSHGNGQFVYRPNLTSASTDFEDGVYDSTNVQPGARGLMLRSAGEGFAVFEVSTPYVIAPIVGDLEDASDDRQASVVAMDATGASLSLSVDNGLTWQSLPTGNAVDLTTQVKGCYGYLLRIQLRGEPEAAVVRSLEIITWVQVHPASLPSLRPGLNRMRLTAGDSYGLASRVVAIRPDVSNQDDFLKHLVAQPADYDPARRTSRVRGSFVMKVPAPARSKIAWFSAGASFAAALGPGNKTRNAIEYAVGEPANFRTVYRDPIPADQGHWHYNVDREVKLTTPARELFVRYVGDPALNNVRIYAHCLEDRPPTALPISVTHVWTENGVPRSRQVEVLKDGEYQIEAGSNAVDESIAMAIATRAK